MKVVDTPSVVMVNRPVLDLDGVEGFLRSHNVSWEEFQKMLHEGMELGDRDAEWIVELGARLCYMSFGGKGRSHEDHLKHVIEVGHGSVLEHSYFGFVAWGISRSLTHELVRHRAGVSYSQLSQRYVDESDTDFVVPPAIVQLGNANPDMYQKWVRHMEESVKLYKELTSSLSEMYSDVPEKTERRKKARQAARSVLPNATETKIYIGANVRAIRHMIEMRANPAADLEIRKLFVEIFKICKREIPLLFFDMELSDLPDGTQGVEAKHRKV